MGVAHTHGNRVPISFLLIGRGLIDIANSGRVASN